MDQENIREFIMDLMEVLLFGSEFEFKQNLFEVKNSDFLCHFYNIT